MIEINLNADVGETLGAHEHEFDRSILDIVQSVSIACGLYAGDPPTMHWIARCAAAQKVSVGAHPGYNDLWGYGRRRIEMPAAHLEYLIASQIGALQAIAVYHGQPVSHVKAHAALYNLAATDRATAMAIGQAIKAVDPALIYVALAGSEMERAGRDLGLRVAREGFCDRLYEPDGTLTPRRIPGAVLTDPARAAQQAVQMVIEKSVTARQGKTMPLDVDTLCIHTDSPQAVVLARAVSEALRTAGVALRPLPDLAPR